MCCETIRSNLRPVNSGHPLYELAMLWVLGQVWVFTYTWQTVTDGQQVAYDARKGRLDNGPSGASSLCIRAAEHCSPG
ncbi:unnamed protein product [Fusarium venenatum]|uniref:Uncharacterized protein n=1 Tax=Fusarium venenatum TaxID=56646 RepID=A0A2L2STL1_9HYPO|nr:LOW QUALITY PROTEIN: uncharacterized protein FVRRES_11476 [Fusarium venenatum]CEI38785.1 unnamed protein product [Fusarium venenatum]